MLDEEGLVDPSRLVVLVDGRYIPYPSIKVFAHPIHGVSMPWIGVSEQATFNTWDSNTDEFMEINDPTGVVCLIIKEKDNEEPKTRRKSGRS